MMSGRPVVVLTGGPCGGKSTLIEDLRRDPKWSERFVVLPEAVQYARFANIPFNEKLFQRLVVNIQVSLEDALIRTLDPEDKRLIICHRGCLDPLAYWLRNGWTETDFFSYTGTRREDLFLRYRAVIHLVTAADGVPVQYTRWPVSHRPEEPQEAARLDCWLRQIWCEHPGYYFLDNEGRNWEKKSAEAREILTQVYDDWTWDS